MSQSSEAPSAICSERASVVRGPCMVMARRGLSRGSVLLPLIRILRGDTKTVVPTFSLKAFTSPPLRMPAASLSMPWM